MRARRAETTQVAVATVVEKVRVGRFTRLDMVMRFDGKEEALVSWRKRYIDMLCLLPPLFYWQMFDDKEQASNHRCSTSNRARGEEHS